MTSSPRELKSLQAIKFSKSGAHELLSWRVKEGEQVKIGSVLFEYRPLNQTKVSKFLASSVGLLSRVLIGEGGTLHNKAIICELQKNCEHPEVVCGMCSLCGDNLQSGDDSVKTDQIASIPIVLGVPQILVSKKQAEDLAKEDKLRLLRQNKLALIVDLDQTLVHTSTDVNIRAGLPDVYGFRLKNYPLCYHARLRPFVHEFLNKISSLYELYIFTMGTHCYAHTLSKILDPERKLFSQRIISRDECFDSRSKLPTIRSVFPCGDEMVAIIDDREDMWARCPNLVHVKPYIFFGGTGDIHSPDVPSRHPPTQVVQPPTSTNPIGQIDYPPSSSQPMADTPDIKLDSPEETLNLEEPVTPTPSREDSDPATPLINPPSLSTLPAAPLATVHSTPPAPPVDPVTPIAPVVPIDTIAPVVPVPLVDPVVPIDPISPVVPVPLVDPVVPIDPVVPVDSVAPVDPTAPIGPINKSDTSHLIISSSSDSSDSSESSSNSSSNTSSSQAGEQRKQSGAGKKKGKSGVKEPVPESEIIPPAPPEGGKGEEGELKDKLPEITDPDRFLLYLVDILTTVHTRFFKKYSETQAAYGENPSPDQELSIPDLKEIIPWLRHSILRRANIVFTGVIPKNRSPEEDPLWNTARAFGATIQTRITRADPGDKREVRQTTHVVASKPGTDKYREAVRIPGIHIVTPEWVWACAESWKWVGEKNFPIRPFRSTKEKLGQHTKKPHLSSEGQEFGEKDEVTNSLVETELAGELSSSAIEQMDTFEPEITPTLPDTHLDIPQLPVEADQVVSPSERLSFSLEDIVAMNNEIEMAIDDSSSENDLIDYPDAKPPSRKRKRPPITESASENTTETGSSAASTDKEGEEESKFDYMDELFEKDFGTGHI